MQINRIASMAVETAHPNDTIEQVASRMYSTNAGFMPIVENGRIVGVVTDRDIAVRAVARGLDTHWASVKRIMSEEVFWLYEDAEHEDACRVMMDKGVRRLVVCDHQDRPVGVLSIDDLALFGHGDDTVGRVLEHVVAPNVVRGVFG